MANIGPDNFELVKELLGDKNTMNRSTLEEVLFEELGFSREMSRVFCDSVFPDHFGCFSNRRRGKTHDTRQV